MDDVDEYIRNELERLKRNATATSGSSRPSLPVQPVLENVQQPDRDRAPRMVHFSEEGAFVAPVASTSSAAVCACRFPYPSTEPYRVMVEEPVNRRSEVVQVASKSRGCAGVGSISRQENNEPTVEIVEQPVRSKRFRYDSEIESAGAIQGVQTTKDRKSFPKIKIRNYVGPARITVSLVCKDAPYRVHPNGVVGKKSSSELPYIYVKEVQIPRKNCVISFNDLGIRIVKLHQIEAALRLRKDQNVDPFGQGFSHEFDPKTDNIRAVRLCFQVKLAQKHMLDPVVSDVIYHSRNAEGCLQIYKIILMCRCRPSNTDEKVVIKTQQLNPKDVEVVFYKVENDEVWEHCVTEFDMSETRGIVCAVPPYPRSSIEYDTTVNVKLRRPSDGACGDPVTFTYCADADAIIERKRKKQNNILQYFVKNNWTPPASLPSDLDSQYDQDWRNMPGPFDVNQTTPGLSSVNPAVPGPSSVNPAVPRPSYVNSAVPEPSFASQALPRPSSTNPAVSGLNHDNSVMARSSYANPAVPGPSSINPAVPEQSSVNAAVSGLNQVNSGKPQPSHVHSAQCQGRASSTKTFHDQQMMTRIT